MYEFRRTIESLWSAVRGTQALPPYSQHADLCATTYMSPGVAFISEHPEYVMWNSAMGFLSDNGGTDYNLCHCAFLFFPERTITYSRNGFAHHHCDAGHGYEIVWSNFEIADLDFWRGEAYTAFFEYLDRHGGFYYEVL